MLLVSTLHLRSLRVSELLSLIGILQGTTAARRISKYTARALWKYLCTDGKRKSVAVKRYAVS
jgi:hypothetical protein